MRRTRQGPPWGGRFGTAPHPLAAAFTASIHVDHRLVSYDVRGSIAHAKMLRRVGLLTPSEERAIVAGLAAVEEEFREGRVPFDPALEDVHMHVERRLIDRIGPAGAKLHTGRSRNDQVALDLRLYVRDALAGLRGALRDLERALVSLAEGAVTAVLPGYTHLRRAQPVLFAHHVLAYYEMLARDAGRFADAAVRAEVLPLGAGALAGSGLPQDRPYLARLLGFRAVARNSMDAVSDRDFVIETVAACALTMTHLSRLAEDLILFSSDEFGFLRLPEAFCTGSSLMPHKMNPDVLELVRGRAGRVAGDLVTLLTMMKGLPLTYDRDLQEDKEPLFDAVETTGRCLTVLAALVPGVRLDRKRMAQALEGGFLLATDAADYLVRKGMPFREAHTLIGRLVRECIETGRRLEDLSAAEWRRASRLFGTDIGEYLTIDGALRRRAGVGGTAPAQVRRVLAQVRRELRGGGTL